MFIYLIVINKKFLIFKYLYYLFKIILHSIHFFLFFFLKNQLLFRPQIRWIASLGSITTFEILSALKVCALTILS